VNTDRVRVAAVGDLHCAKAMTPGTLAPVFGPVAERAEVLALCGDLTDTGTAEEAKLLVRELALAKVPVVAVLGNHDYESEKADEVKKIFADAGITVLDGDSVEIRGVGFAGVTRRTSTSSCTRATSNGRCRRCRRRGARRTCRFRTGSARRGAARVTAWPPSTTSGSSTASRKRCSAVPGGSSRSRR